MKTVTLTRGASKDNGTFGVLVSDAFRCMTVELPWRDNMPGKSCIPAGSYTCNLRMSPAHGCDLFHVDGVQGRTEVEIHAANWGGDVDLGLHSDLMGCIGLGKSVEAIETPEGKMQNGVTSSRPTLYAFMTAMAGQSFQLVIQWVPGQEPAASPA